VLNSSQLDLVRSSGFCDFLIVEKLGCGISRGRYENVKYLYTHCCGSGSGFRCLFDPWIRDPEWVKKNRVRIRDDQPGSYFRMLKNRFFWLKYLNHLMRIRDGKTSYPGSGMENIRIRGKLPDRNTAYPKGACSVPDS
jgi:hypothetical protein